MNDYRGMKAVEVNSELYYLSRNGILTLHIRLVGKCSGRVSLINEGITGQVLPDLHSIWLEMKLISCPVLTERLLNPYRGTCKQQSMTRTCPICITACQITSRFKFKSFKGQIFCVYTSTQKVKSKPLGLCGQRQCENCHMASRISLADTHTLPLPVPHMSGSAICRP